MEEAGWHFSTQVVLWVIGKQDQQNAEANRYQQLVGMAADKHMRSTTDEWRRRIVGLLFKQQTNLVFVYHFPLWIVLQKISVSLAWGETHVLNFILLNYQIGVLYHNEV